MVAAVNPSLLPQQTVLPPSAPQVILPSPIQAETQGGLIPKDTAINANPAQRLKMGVHDLTDNLPYTIRQGLKGSDTFTFSDQMLLARTVPYTLGGATLAGIYGLAGGSRLPLLNAAVGVGLYMAAQSLATRAVREAWHLQTGLDLNQLYKVAKSPDSHPHYERLYASTAWPRTDLLPQSGTPQSVDELARQFDIPDSVNDRKGAVAKRIRQLIGQSRINELLVANTAAAIGAGYVARSQAWGSFADLPAILNDRSRGNLLARLGTVAEAAATRTGAVLKDLIPTAETPAGRKAAFALALGAQLLATGWTLRMLNSLPGKPHYQQSATPEGQPT